MYLGVQVDKHLFERLHQSFHMLNVIAGVFKKTSTIHYLASKVAPQPQISNTSLSLSVTTMSIVFHVFICVYSMYLLSVLVKYRIDVFNPFINDIFILLFFVFFCFLLCSFISSIVVICCCTTTVCMKGLCTERDERSESRSMQKHRSNISRVQTEQARSMSNLLYGFTLVKRDFSTNLEFSG